jgi:hypothetical protein
LRRHPSYLAIFTGVQSQNRRPQVQQRPGIMEAMLLNAGLSQEVIKGLIIEPSRATAKEWDNFSSACGCSFRCGYNASALWLFDRRLGAATKRFAIFLRSGNGRIQIGQFAIRLGGRIRVFADQVQLLPTYEQCWCGVMEHILCSLGPGRYRYGSKWITERPRDEHLSLIPGVTIEVSRAFFFEIIDFTRWASWDDYWRAISANARRNHNKATQDTILVLQWRCGLSFLREFLPVMRLRRSTLRRKGINPSVLTWILWNLRAFARTWCLSAYVACLTARRGGVLLAFSYFIEFGQITFYLEGGSRTNNNGAAWMVLLSTIKRAYERTNGCGRFIMGAVNPAISDTPPWQGLARSRKQCLATQHPASVLTFAYTRDHRPDMLMRSACPPPHGERSNPARMTAGAAAAACQPAMESFLRDRKADLDDGPYATR